MSRYGVVSYKNNGVSQQLLDYGAPLDCKITNLAHFNCDPLVLALENYNVKISSELRKQTEEQHWSNRTDKNSWVVDYKSVKCVRFKRLDHISRNYQKTDKKFENFNTKDKCAACAVNGWCSEYWLRSVLSYYSVQQERHTQRLLGGYKPSSHSGERQSLQCESW